MPRFPAQEYTRMMERLDESAGTLRSSATFIRQQRERIIELEREVAELRQERARGRTFEDGYAQGRTDALTEVLETASRQGQPPVNTCETCRLRPGPLREDPFQAEIRGDHTLHYLCDLCSYESAMEI